MARPARRIERLEALGLPESGGRGLTALGLLFVAGFVGVAYQWYRAEQQRNRAEINAANGGSAC